MKIIPFFKEKVRKKHLSSEESEETFAVKVIEESNGDSITSPSKETFSLNDSDDDLSANLLSSVFGIIEERRKLAQLIVKYKEQMSEMQAINSGILEEKRQIGNSLKDREKQLENLQYQLGEYQEKCQELIEDHKLLKINELKEQKRLQQQIKELQADYESLSTEYKQFQEDKNKEIIGYKDALREEKEKYSHLQLQFNKLTEDNNILMEKISAFAKQISSVQMFNSIFLSDKEKRTQIIPKGA